MNGTLQLGDKDASLLESGYDFDNLRLTVGADYRFTDNVVAGLAVGYGKTDLEFIRDAGTLDTDTLLWSLYGSYYVKDNFYLDGIASFGDTDYDSMRRVVYTDATGTVDRTAEGVTSGTQFAGGIGGGYNFTRNAWTFGPNGGVYYLDMDVDPFSETGAGGLDLGFGTQEVKSLTANLGFHASYAFSRKWGVIIPHFRGDFIREFEEDAGLVNVIFVADPFANDPLNPTPNIVYRTDIPDTNYGNLALGVSAQFVNGISAFADYQTLLGFNRVTSHELTLGVRFETKFGQRDWRDVSQSYDSAQSTPESDTGGVESAVTEQEALVESQEVSGSLDVAAAEAAGTATAAATPAETTVPPLLACRSRSGGGELDRIHRAVSQRAG